MAQALGVSHTTVSNAFSRPDQLSAKMRERVLSKARELGYAGPSAAGRILATGRTGALGVLYHQHLPYAFTDPASTALLQGLSGVCQDHENGLLVLTGIDADGARQAIQRAAMDAVIVYAVPPETGLLDAVLARGLPTVTIDQPMIAGVPSVNIDDRGAARAGARLLLDLGHRSLAALSAPLRFWINHQRLRGYREALRKPRCNSAELLEVECDDNSEQAGKQAALLALAREPRPTGILAMSDRLAIGALRAAEQCGLQVPRDLSLVGFDDISVAAHLSPPLTTVRQPLVEKGAVAGRLILAADRLGQQVVLPTELIVRESSGPVPRRVVASKGLFGG